MNGGFIMSCEFCNKFEFAAVTIKDNNIHFAGGSNRFTDGTWDNSVYKLFQYCPLCGARLLYKNSPAPERLSEVARVACDEQGNKIDYAVYDADVVIDEKAYKVITQLKTDTGCAFVMCKNAYYYALAHKGDYDMMIAYCKAKVVSVDAKIPFDARVKEFMDAMK